MNQLLNFAKNIDGRVYNMTMVKFVIGGGGTQKLEDKREKRIDKRQREVV